MKLKLVQASAFAFILAEGFDFDKDSFFWQRVKIIDLSEN